MSDNISSIINYNDIQRSSNEFNFSKILNSLVVNREFSKNYNDNDDNDNNLTSSNKQSYIWYALSAIGNDIGGVLYNNTLNYVDLVSNVDLCKVKSLKSMISLLGIHYTLFDNLDFIPIEILNIIDVLSINKKYLFNPDVLDIKLINDLKKYATKEITISSDNISSNTSAIFDEEKFSNYITNVFYNVLSSNITMKYDNYSDNQLYVYQNISNQLVEEPLLVDNNILNDEFRIFKIQNNINVKFDHVEIVDKINDGLEELSNYSGPELSLLQMEIDYRKEPFDISKNFTRYKYYKERKVKEYVNFIENQIYNENEVFSLNEYNIDKRYIEVDTPNKKYLINVKKEKDKTTSKTKLIFSVDENMIKYVANELKNITFKIIELRDKIKTNVQQGYIKGTFNLVSFVINEYLTNYSNFNNLKNEISVQLNTIKEDNPELYNSFILNGEKTAKYKELEDDIDLMIERLSSYQFSNIKLVEYYDVTEYFNLSTDNTKYAKNSEYINQQFWNNSQSTVDLKSIAENEISNYYSNILEIKNNNLSSFDNKTYLDTFLSTIYKLGADSSYVDKDSDKPKTVNNIIYNNLFKSYIGNLEYTNLFYYNFKNKTHPTYQVHPYLYNFIESTDIIETIKNSFYGESTSEAINKLTIKNINQVIGNYGEVLDLYINNLNTYHGYKAEYESIYHSQIKNNLLEGFDGAFYPDAVEDLFKNETCSADCINSIRTKTIYSNDEKTELTFFGKYYYSLNLTTEEYNDIADKLSANINLIYNIVTNQNNLNYNIYKYTKDVYNNSYILYKSYNRNSDLTGFTNRFRFENINQYLSSNMILNNIDYSGLNVLTNKENYYSQCENTLGELWIRINNQPIAFPALYGENPQLVVDSTNDTDLNGRFENLTVCGEHITGDQKDKFKNDMYHMRYFYDMEMEQNGKVLYLYNTSITDQSSRFKNSDEYLEIIKENKLSDYQSIEKTDIIISTIKYEFDHIKNKNTLRFIADEINYCDCIDNPGIFETDKNKEYFFKGAFTYKNKKIFFFVESVKTHNEMRWSTDIDIHANINCRFGVYEYHQNFLQPLDYIPLKLTDVLYNDKYIIDYRADDFYYTNFKCSYSSENDSFMVLMLIHNREYVTDIINENLLSAKVNLNNIKDDDSFEFLNSHIGLFSYKFNYEIQFELDFIESKLYNLHVDASYFPSYPGLNGLNDYIKGNYLKNKEIKNVQLLGNKVKKSEIENKINQIKDLYNITEENTDNLDSTVKDNIFSISSLIDGRIFEMDHSLEDYLNKSVYVYKNSLINTETTAYYKPEKNKFEISIDLEQHFYGYSGTDKLYDINIMFYNSDTYGKNPYYMGPISSYIQNVPENVNLEDFIDSSDTLHYYVNYTNISNIINEEEVYINSTLNPLLNPLTYLENNYIYGISSIDMIITNTNKFIINLNIDSNLSNEIDKIYIDDNKLNLIIYNKYELGIYQIYHFIDIFGNLSCVDENNELITLDIDSIELSNYRLLDDVPYIGFTNFNVQIDVSLGLTSLLSNLNINANIYECRNYYVNTYQQQIQALAPYINIDINNEKITLVDCIKVYNDLASCPFLHINKISDKSNLKDLIKAINNLTTNLNKQYQSEIKEGQSKKVLSFKMNESLNLKEYSDRYSKNVYPINLLEKFEEINNIDKFNLNLTSDFKYQCLVDTLANNSNIYLNKFNSDTVVDNIINVKIDNELYSEYSKSYRVYEFDTDVGDSIYNYSLNDPRALKFFKAREFYTELELTTPYDSAVYQLTEKELGTILNTDDNNNIIEFLNLKKKYNKLFIYKTENENITDIEYKSLNSFNYKPNLKTIIKEQKDNDFINNYITLYCLYDDNNTLYFNYSNFYNSPYIKVIDGEKISIDIIPGTYLKLKPGEDGILNIVLQFTKFINKKVYGVKNVIVYSYRIYNVSDDKPKFVAYKNYEINN